MGPASVKGGNLLSMVDGDGKLRPMHEIEYQVILSAVEYCEGNMTLVARGLGIGRSTLYRKLSARQKQESSVEDRAVSGSKQSRSTVPFSR